MGSTMFYHGDGENFPLIFLLLKIIFLEFTVIEIYNKNSLSLIKRPDYYDIRH